MNQTSEKQTFSLSGRVALRITVVYLLVGCLGIMLSDQALALLVPDVTAFARLSTYKGRFFVLGTALLIFFLVDRALGRTQRAEKGLHDSLASYRELAESIGDVFLGLDASLRSPTGTRPAPS